MEAHAHLLGATRNILQILPFSLVLPLQPIPLLLLINANRDTKATKMEVLTPQPAPQGSLRLFTKTGWDILPDSPLTPVLTLRAGQLGTREPSKHIPLQAQTCPGLHVLSGLYLHFAASQGKPTAGLTLLAHCGEARQLPTRPEPSPN